MLTAPSTSNPGSSANVQTARRIISRQDGLADRCEVLEARLTACVAVFEALLETRQVAPSCRETIERVVRHSTEALAAGGSR